MIAAEHDTDDTGIEILPGVVCVNLTVTSARSVTVDVLRKAMAEAEAQAQLAELDTEELLGDLDINPL